MADRIHIDVDTNDVNHSFKTFEGAPNTGVGLLITAIEHQRDRAIISQPVISLNNYDQ